MTITPGTLALRANRWTPFVYSIDIEGLDLTGATLAMQVRERKDGGNIEASLSAAAAGSQGLSLTVDTTGTDPVTTITIQIDETTMESMSAATEAGDDAVFYWDMHVTPTGGIKQVYFAGTFTVVAGSTQ